MNKTYNRKEVVDWVRGIYQNLDDADKRDALRFFPELAETEDERVREKCMAIISKWTDENDRQECLAYLEKQKENKDELVYRLNGLMQDYIKEGKDDEEKEHRLKCYQLFWDALEDTNFDQKEQKSTNIDYISGIREELLSIENNAKDIGGLTESQWVAIRAAHRLLGEYIEQEQKPTDDKAFEEWIEDYWEHHKVNNPDSYNKGDEIQFDERGFKNFCRGIRNMYQQKPAEIDFEDWDTLGYIRDIVRKHVIRDEEFNVLDKWLTKHYVNQKLGWSEEDERIIKDAIYDLEEVGGYPYTVKGLKSLLKARIKT